MQSRDATDWEFQDHADSKSARPRHTRTPHALRRCAWIGSLMALIALGLHAQPVLPAENAVSPPPNLSLANPLLPRDKPSDAAAKRLWQVSLLTLSVANALDVHSSLGKHELNPTLAGPSGTFGSQGILLKSALQGGLMGIEYLVTRSRSHGSLTERPRSKLYRSLALINFASTGVISGIAIHNYTVPRYR